VIGSFAFVSMFLERSAKREIEAVQQRVRQEENARLGTQIAHLDRQRALGAMSTSFAHELSQPLTAILMDAQTLKVGLQAGDMATHEVLTLIDSVEGHTTRTVQLVERIRDFIRPTKSFYALVDLKQLLRDVADLLAHDIRVQKVQITYDLEAVDCVVQGDRVQLSQILLNVYRNAMQAMLNQDKKHILVTMEQQERQVVLRIQDNGNGVIDAIKDKVGQAFVTTKEGGLGVGLSISRTIAELHGGSLTIANAVGSGALVELNLPRAA
jgi:C4-dicarboxylate-specific signal transduction histidine kinase